MGALKNQIFQSLRYLFEERQAQPHRDSENKKSSISGI
jgi:hypothetical protein